MIVAEEAKHNRNSFTLVELLMALVVTGIILTAVITLAFALVTANDSSSDIAQQQAQLRYATLGISELIKQCRLICGTPGNGMVIWKADYNDDSRINAGELVYIELGEERNRIRLLEFSPSSFSVEWFTNNSFTIQEIKFGQAKVELWIRCREIYTNVFPQCGNAQFLLDTPAPQTRLVSISFELEEDGIMHEYQINASLRAWAGNLLDSSGEIIDGDDD